MSQAKIGWRSNEGPSINYLLASISSISTPILDTYTSSSAAFSLRKLSTTYSGSAIRVRRSSDNTEQNIGFDASGNLDTTSLLSFVGAGNGFVTTWFDQSGNGKHATQTTASRQPSIVISGAVNMRNSRPAIKFNGNGIYLAALGITTSIKSSFTVFNKDTANWGGPIGGQTIYPSPWKYRNNGNSTIPYSNEKSGLNGVGGSNNIGQGDPPFPSAIFLNNSRGSLTTGSSTIALPNATGLNLISYFVPTSQAGTKNIGIGVDPYDIQNWGLIGSISEIIFFSDDLLSNVTDINANVNSYFSIYSQDTNPLTAAAYSLRKLRSDYTGSAIRVRRSSDNAETNIGFVNGNLDEAALSAFAGSNNTFLYSEEFDNAYWSKSGVSITANQGIAPDGTQTADLFQETAGSGQHYLSKSGIVAGFGVNSSWNMSFYIKKASNNTATSNKIMMRQAKNDYTDGGTTAVFDLDSGQVVYTTEGSVQGGTFGILGATMTDEGNGWWRCSMRGKRPVAVYGSQNAEVSIAIGKVPLLDNWNNPISNVPGYQISWNGDTNGKYLIWGAQMTFKNGDDSYQNIKTYTKTTTTNPGSAYVTTWFDQSGNGRNLTQATAINQPSIIEDSTIVKLNGKPVLSFLFTGTTRKWLGMPANSTTINPPFSMFLNMKIQGSAYDFNIISGLETNKRFGISSFSVGNWTPSYTFWASDNNYIGGSVANLNNSIHFVYTSASENTLLGVNGSSTTKYITPGAWKSIQIGMSDTGQFYAPELIFFYGNKTGSRTSVESNMNTYYSVY